MSYKHKKDVHRNYRWVTRRTVELLIIVDNHIGHESRMGILHIRFDVVVVSIYSVVPIVSNYLSLGSFRNIGNICIYEIIIAFQMVDTL